MRIAAPLYLAVLFLLAFAGHTYFFHLTEHVSISGYSAIELIVRQEHPENFIKDFSSGNMEGSSHALISLAYAPLHRLTGLSGVSILTLMVGLEVLCVILGALVLWSVLVPAGDGQKRGLRAGVFCMLATVLVAGYVIRPNLSNFGYPFFHGQFYGYADAIAMVAVAAFIRRRWGALALLLCLGFMVHPIKILIAAAFIGGAALAGGRETINARSLAAGGLVALFAVAWGYFWLGFGQPGNVPPIPHDAYIAYTRAWQYHWYPFDRGLFSDNQYNGLSPFMAVMLMGALALQKSPLPAALRKQWLGGMGMLAALTFVGLWFSYSLGSVFMIKLALIRASEMMVTFTPFIVFAAVCQQWREGDTKWVAVFAGFLLAGMPKVAGLSVVIAALAVALYFYDESRRRRLFAGESRRADLVLATCAVVAPATSLLLALVYPSGSVGTPLVSCLPFVFAVWLLFSRRLHAFAARFVRFDPADLALPVLCLAFFAAAAAYLVGNYWMNDKDMAKAHDFYAVQRWAQANTASDAQFMIDPCYAYAWREFSERGSIGTPFNWYHTGWLYVSDNRVFERGQAIGRSLGLDFADKLPSPGERARLVNYEVCAMAQDLFYDPSLAALHRMAKEQGVDYFVMETDRSQKLIDLRHVKTVFANNNYRVLAAKDLP